MDARQMSAMVEATRLTCQGRLAEATALIQRTLTSAPAPRQAPDGQGRLETGGASGRQPAPSPLLPAHGGRQLRHGPSGWAHGLSAFGSLRVPDPDLAHGPVAPAANRSPGRFDSFSYTGAAGTRAYLLYVPAGSTGGPLPLVVMLHGGTQDAATFAAATGMNDLAER